MKRLRRRMVDHTPLPLFPGDDLPRYHHRRRARRFVQLVQLNPLIAQILDRLPQLSVEAWLVSGSLVQTIWNLRQGRPAAARIDDYDLIYLDPDTSWEKEDAVIVETERLYAGLGAPIQIRNQARVPLWYRGKHGIDYPPVAAAHLAVRRYPSRSTAVALSRTRCGEWLFYAPFGFDDLRDLRVRPNRRLPLASVYDGKTTRWRTLWPALTIDPWDAGSAPLEAIEHAV